MQLDGDAVLVVNEPQSGLFDFLVGFDGEVRIHFPNRRIEFDRFVTLAFYVVGLPTYHFEGGKVGFVEW